MRYRRQTRRRGFVAPFVAISLIALFGITALTVDVGYIYVTQGEMQAAMDAAALAGASAVQETGELAVQRAKALAATNVVALERIKNHEVTVDVGYWEAGTRTFSATSPTGAAPNAARVIGRRTGIPLFFAAILGQAHTDVGRFATAVSGGGICLGIWGLDLLDADGDITTDSYDSSAGAYGAGNIYNNGDICSDRNIELEGGVEIGGDAMYGYGYDLTISGNSYRIYGVTSEQNRSVTIPEIDMLAASLINDNLTIGLTDKNRDPFAGSPWDLVVTGNDSLTLNPGTYYFTSAAIGGRATLTVTGPTTIYVDGDATFTGGGIVNATQVPTNLTIYSTGTTMTVDGSAGFYGSIVAPETTVNFAGTADIYGTVMARVLTLFGNTQIHVDSDAVRQLYGIGPIAPVLVQ